LADQIELGATGFKFDDGALEQASRKVETQAGLVKLLCGGQIGHVDIDDHRHHGGRPFVAAALGLGCFYPRRPSWRNRCRLLLARRLHKFFAQSVQALCFA